MKFGSTVSCSLTRETRLTKHKPTAQHTRLLDCMKCATLNGDSFTHWSLSTVTKVLCGRVVVCLSQEHLGYLLDKAYNLLKWKFKTSQVIAWACQYTTTLITIAPVCSCVLFEFNALHCFRNKMNAFEMIM